MVWIFEFDEEEILKELELWNKGCGHRDDFFYRCGDRLHNQLDFRYLKDILEKKEKENAGFKVTDVNVVTEIINPKHHEIANNYSSSSVVISDRYISKMVSQICEKEALFDFYQDILTYDSDEEAERLSTV